MNLDAFRHSICKVQSPSLDYSFCAKCPYLSVRRWWGDITPFCTGNIPNAVNITFGTSFAPGTPIPILADFVEEHDDGTPEFAELVKFLRGATPKRSITDNLSYVPLTEVVWGL